MANKQNKSNDSPREKKAAVSVIEYRRILRDNTSTDKQVIERLAFLEMLCRQIIKEELQRYGAKN